MTWLVMRGMLSRDTEVVQQLYPSPIPHTGGAIMLFDGRGSAPR